MTPSGEPPVVGYLDVFPFLMAACPTFPGSPEAERADPNDGEFLVVGHFVAHLIRLLDEGTTDCFEAIFGVVEWVLTYGDREASSLISEGFLDDLSDRAVYSSTDRRLEDLITWVGPLARAQLRIDPDT